MFFCWNVGTTILYSAAEIERHLSISLFWHLIISVNRRCALRFSLWEKNIEQSICLKFCVLNRISCAESLKMLQKGLWRVCFRKTRVYEWHKTFAENRVVVDDLPRKRRYSCAGIPSLQCERQYVVTLACLTKESAAFYTINWAARLVQKS